jgi:hypothetical protein
MSKKLYFETNDSEFAYTEEYFQDTLEQEGLFKIEVWTAELSKERGLFFCTEHSFCSADSSDSCGKLNCNEYEPRNKKNGRCRFHSSEIYNHGEKIILKYKK